MHPMYTRRQRQIWLTVCVLAITILANQACGQTAAATAPSVVRSVQTSPPILDIGHETDLSEYDRIAADGGDLSQSSAAALANSAGGMQVRIDDQVALYGDVDFATIVSSAFRFRFYFDPNGLSMNNRNSFVVSRIMDGNTARYWINLSYNGDNYEIQLGIRDDSGAVQYSPSLPVTDREHSLQVLIGFSTGASAISPSAGLGIV